MSEIEIRLNHAGCIGLLEECSVAIGNGEEKAELREAIEQCMSDFAQLRGGSVRRILHRIEYQPPAL